jgi:Family of unknown function (DUF6188)
VIRLVFDRPSEEGSYVDVHRCRLMGIGGPVLIDSAGPPLDTAPILQILKESVVGATAADGVLTLTFANGLKLEALPDEEHESWTVSGPETFVICGPGGEIDVFGEAIPLHELRDRDPAAAAAVDEMLERFDMPRPRGFPPSGEDDASR